MTKAEERLREYLTFNEEINPYVIQTKQYFGFNNNLLYADIREVLNMLEEARKYIKSTGIYETNINPETSNIYNLELIRINDKLLKILGEDKKGVAIIYENTKNKRFRKSTSKTF